MVENSQEYRLKYWATRSSVRSFARTAPSFCCSALLVGLLRSATLTRSLARSLTPSFKAIIAVFFLKDHSEMLTTFPSIPGAATSASRWYLFTYEKTRMRKSGCYSQFKSGFHSQSIICQKYTKTVQGYSERKKRRRKAFFFRIVRLEAKMTSATKDKGQSTGWHRRRKTDYVGKQKEYRILSRSC